MSGVFLFVCFFNKSGHWVCIPFKRQILEWDGVSGANFGIKVIEIFSGLNVRKLNDIQM